MVAHDLAARDIHDERVLAAMESVPREHFVPEDLVDAAYEDRPLPIGVGQTISQPYIVALMAQEARIRAADRVLEVGTGSGYGAAVLGRLAAEVWTIERHEDLARRAREALEATGAGNVHVDVGDGSLGAPDSAPFDAIVVTAAAPAVPDALVAQLADGGRLVIPIGPDGHAQELVRVTRRGEHSERAHLCDVRFVPLIGAEGFGRTGGGDDRNGSDPGTSARRRGLRSDQRASPQGPAPQTSPERGEWTMADEWGPLATLAGEWQGEGGLDTAYSHSQEKVLDTPYLEKATFKPFGPVDNGSQSLYGLDYHSAMWRGNEDLPFHTEVGYWLWDAATGEVMRCFVVPRGITTFAGGTAAADATEFTLSASAGHDTYSIGENKYLAQHASTRTYEVTITIDGPDTWSYHETTTLRMDQFPELFPHTDHNTLHRVA